MPAFGALAGGGWSALLGMTSRMASGLSAVAIPVAVMLAVTIGGVMAGGPLFVVISAAVAVACPTVLGSAAGVFLVSLSTRVAATLLHPWAGLLALPRNFRRLMVCTSPIQPPELVPGLIEDDTRFTFQLILNAYHDQKELLGRIFYLIVLAVWFLPGWLYRFSVKSTAWFWCPLAYFGGEARLAKTPEKFHRKTFGTLWAMTNVALAVVTILSFIMVNFVLDGAIFKTNPLLTVFGYFLVVDWSQRSWQLFAFALALLSLALVFLVDDANRDYRDAVKTKDRVERVRVERNLVLIERLARLRFIFALAFWILVGGQTVLYFNGRACWMPEPANLQDWAEFVYGARTPPPPICP